VHLQLRIGKHVHGALRIAARHKAVSQFDVTRVSFFQSSSTRTRSLQLETKQETEHTLCELSRAKE
jgi:hypothetical protein